MREILFRQHSNMDELVNLATKTDHPGETLLVQVVWTWKSECYGRPRALRIWSLVEDHKVARAPWSAKTEQKTRPYAEHNRCHERNEWTLGCEPRSVQ